MKAQNFRSCLFCILIVIYSKTSFALDLKSEVQFRPENNISIGFAGDVSLFSLDYERLFIRNRKVFVTGKIGFGVNAEPGIPNLSLKSYNVESYQYSTESSQNSKPNYFTIPHHITGNTGKGRHFFEYGLGGTYLSGYNKSYFLYPILGYRLQPLRSGQFCFRFFLCIPFTGLETTDLYHFPVGLSLGISL